MGWRDWLGVGEARTGGAERTEVVARIARALDGLAPDRARVVAAFVYHLGRIAHADHEITEAERSTIHSLVAVESGRAASDLRRRLRSLTSAR